MPKYRTSGRIKEFAFVEFEDKSSVEKCIDAFRQFNAVIGDTQDPENLKSVVAYVKEQEDLEKEEENQEQPQAGDNKENKEQTETDSENKGDIEVEEEKPNVEGDTNVNEMEADASTTVDQEEPEKKVNKRTNEEPAISDSDEVPPTKRFKTEESEAQEPQESEVKLIKDEKEDKEAQEDIEAQGSTTDEKASVTDDNQDQKKKK